MDKEYLESQYSPSRWSKVKSPDEIITNHCNIICKESKHALEETANEIDIKYGSKDGQKLDIFFPQSKGKGAPILMFIHGGYWQELGKEYYSYIGRTFGSHGITTIVVGYDLAPKVSLATIFDEIKESVVYVSRRFPSSKITVVGHSAGAHLAALLLMVDWAQVGIPDNPIKAVVPISGLYDLRPLVHTYINEALKMDRQAAWMLSPMRCIEDMRNNVKCHVLCMIAEHESPEFHKQSREFYQSLVNAGFDIKYDVVEGADHFSVMHNFALKNYKPIQQIVNMIYDAEQSTVNIQTEAELNA